MTTLSKIQWTDHTHNPWWGCVRVSPACRFCYADSTAKRWGHDAIWRRSGPRRMMSDAYWRQPLKWNRDAERAERPAKVFCASMSDVFEIHPVADINAELDAARARLWTLIEQTPWLTWQLLTKRPENVAALAPYGSDWPANIWLGASVEDNRRAAERIPVLAAAGARTTFLSAEPLLEQLDLGSWMGTDRAPDWIIAGGESGAKARRTDPAWLRALRDDCEAAGTAFFFKQAGKVLAREWGCTDRNGGDPGEWPEPFPRDFPAGHDAMPERAR